VQGFLGSNVLKFLIVFWFSILGIGFLFFYKGVEASYFEVEIEKPDPCYQVSSIKKNRVYLARRPNCIAPQVIVSEKIKLDAWYEELEIYVDGRLWNKVSLKKMISPEEVLKILEEGEKLSKSFGNFSNIYEEVAKDIAKKVYQETQTPQYQMGVKQYEEALKKLIFEKEGISLKDVYKDYVKKEKLERKVLVLDPDERLYIFVSSSIPRETIRNYVTFVSSHIEGDVVFVLRGGIGGLKRLTPTVLWIYDVIKKDDKCDGFECEVYGVEFVIDPFLFRRYGIERVPAVVYARGKNLTEFEMSEGLGEKFQVQTWAKTYGDMGMAYHLKVIGESLGIEKIKRFIDELNM
jgi:type-F conjugative transfer system pilin assembly protein TrbC